jgi:hypothetical protein
MNGATLVTLFDWMLLERPRRALVIKILISAAQ